MALPVWKLRIPPWAGEQADGATGYNWQINTAADFSNTAGNFEGSTASSTVTLTSLTQTQPITGGSGPISRPSVPGRPCGLSILLNWRPPSPVPLYPAPLLLSNRSSNGASAQEQNNMGKLLVSLNDNFTNLAISRNLQRQCLAK